MATPADNAATGRPVTDPLADAITVLSNVKIENPSVRADTEDAANRVALALDYLRMLPHHRVPCQKHHDNDSGWVWTCPYCVQATAYVTEVRRAAAE